MIALVGDGELFLSSTLFSFAVFVYSASRSFLADGKSHSRLECIAQNRSLRRELEEIALCSARKTPPLCSKCILALRIVAENRASVQGFLACPLKDGRVRSLYCSDR